MVGCRLLDYLQVRKDTYLFFAERALNTSSNLTWLLDTSLPLSLANFATRLEQASKLGTLEF
jgi:hypothetical protein